MSVLSVENLNFTYALGKSRALTDVSFSVEEGEVLTLCGATGSGKSTLLSLLKPQIAPRGEKTGTILFCKQPPEKAKAGEIGFVFQHPEQQIVTDKVWHELAFGLENSGHKSDTIRRRVAETSSFFGIGDWFEKDVSTLSGGQKQLLNLAAVTVMQPTLLLLDEPTAQLDPVAAEEFMTTLKKLNDAFSMTVILAEHDLEKALPVSEKMLVLDHGTIRFSGEKHSVCGQLTEADEIYPALPAAAKIFCSLGEKGESPLTVREGTAFLKNTFDNAVRALPAEKAEKAPGKAALEFSDVHFSYGKNQPDVLCGTDLKISEGEIFCILGGNGSGKTTALSAAAGLLKPQSGVIRIFGKRPDQYKGHSLYQGTLSLLPQEVQTLFLRSTVQEELSDSGAAFGALPFDLSSLSEKHPYDLSGGEQQLLGLAKVLASKPRLLLLDEPTKGLDAGAKGKMIAVFQKLRDEGMTLVIVTHDPDLAARAADRCALFFRGEAVCTDEPHRFFSDNVFYTTAAHRITRDSFDGVITPEEAAALCRANRRKKAGAAT